MNRRPDEQLASRTQITLRLDRDLLATIDELAGDEGMDRTELARRLLSDGLAQHRLRAAVRDVAAGRRSTWDAAARAGVSLYEMLDRVVEEGIPYQLDPEVIGRIRSGPASPGGPAGSSGSGSARKRAAREGPAISRLRSRYRPDGVRVLFVGESAPAGGTHFYLANSNLFRATRESFGRGLDLPNPPDGSAFLDWFKELGCWLVDIAGRPANQLPAGERRAEVEGGVTRLAGTLRETHPERVIVLIRRIAPDVRRAAALAGLDDRSIDVLPFPIRQWRSTFVEQLAAIMRGLGAGSGLPALSSATGTPRVANTALGEAPASYGSATLHDVVAQVLRQHGGGWLKASQIAREIGERDLWRRPTDGAHPRASQVSARVRQYPSLFQTSDLGVRLRTG
ncbi:MAG TPA: ribbon-helix-helix domain-containing protein [Candidatus Sulfomarinibacteraceae bacterium]|nr:ribbon-helix-helix domain-containing protein [Candidatus Sulfomarinibacteraceae bacterium]